MSKYQIPFDKDGNLVNYPDNWSMRDGGEWKDNFEFGSELIYCGYSRGQSSALIKFKCVYTNKKYYMFLSDFDNAVNLMKFGHIAGNFTFVKKGRNYGIKLVGTKNAPN